VLQAPFDIRSESVPDPEILTGRDAVVRVVAACICGSDLWPYRGDPAPPAPRRIGHEFVGVVEAVGDEVRGIHPGEFVVAPFLWSDGTCALCARGLPSSCLAGGGYGADDREGLLVDGGQGEYVRVPQADGTLVAVPGSADTPVDPALVPHLLALSDVMGTGHHAAVSAGVGPGSAVAVVGDGAVGLSAVLACRRLGAERIVAMSRHEARQALAVRFGATDVVTERGEVGAAAVRGLFDSLGADAVLECVGTGEAMRQAFAAVRPGGTVGFVGVPHGVEIPVREMFGGNKRLAGGVAPVRAYLPELMDDVLAGRLEPGAVFDAELALADVAEGYHAMHERRATKVLLRP
jgi:threonine dehydrogenase-like Zn-dependent dehydrogenase